MSALAFLYRIGTFAGHYDILSQVPFGTYGTTQKEQIEVVRLAVAGG